MKFIYSSAIVLFVTLLLTSTPSGATSLSSFLNKLNFSPSIQYGGYNYDSYRRRRGDDDDHYNNDDDDHYGNDDDDDGNDIPLDGGLSFLAVAGAGLGIKKVVEHRNKKRDPKK